MKEFFVGLASSELAELKEVVERADEKERSLMTVLKTAALQYLGRD